MTIKLIVHKVSKFGWKKWLIVIALMTSITLGFYSGKYVKNKYIDGEVSSGNHFNVEYVNTDKKSKIRYKYTLNYEVEDAEAVGKMNLEEPLFSLAHNGKTVSSKFPSFNKSMPVPEVSNSMSIEENKAHLDDYVIKYNEEIPREVLDKVLFEARIDVEKLYNKKWEPEYKTIFIKRGPNLSITNSPY